MDKNKLFTVALVGNPNCGKSAIFNILTGARSRVGNWPGVTVEKREGIYFVGNKKIKIIDLPGAYSLRSHTDDESVSCNYILSGDADLYLNVLDANNLERNLYLTLQLLELGKPIIIVLNMMDVAKQHHIDIDIEKLHQRTGIALVAITAVKKGSAHQLKQILTQALEKPLQPSSYCVDYPDQIENIIDHWQTLLSDASKSLNIATRYLAIKLLEHDPTITMAVDNFSSKNIDEATKYIRKNLYANPATLIAEHRYNQAHQLSEEVTQRSVVERGRNVTDRIDHIVLNKYLAIPIFLFVMYSMFWVVQKIGGSFQDSFDISAGALFVDLPYTLMTQWQWAPWVITLLANGIGSGLQAVASFIPLIFTMFFCLSILEDSGYMSRAAFITDRALSKIGLPGKSFVPLIIGFGCTVPAIIATRSLESRRDKILTIFMAPMMSCGAKLPVLALFTASFFGSNSVLAIFSLYLIGIIIGILTVILLSNSCLKGDASHFIMELPPYHFPAVGSIVKHAWGRLKDFICKAGKFIVIAMIVLGSLNTLSTTGRIAEKEDTKLLAVMGRAITPLFTPFGVEKENWQASVALLTGFFAKEAIIGSLSALYSMDDDDGSAKDFSLSASLMEALKSIPTNLYDALTTSRLISSDSGESEQKEGLITSNLQHSFTQGKWQVYAYLIFILLYVPCLAAMGAATKELGWFYSLILFIYLTLVSWAAATMFYQIMVGHQVGWILGAIAILVTIIMIFFFLDRLDIDSQPRNIRIQVDDSVS